MSSRNRASGWISLFWIALVFGVLFTSKHARGSEVNFFLRGGADIIHAKNAANYSFGIDRFISDSWFLRLDTGFWLDSQLNHSNALYTSILIGGRLGDLTGWHASFAMGPMVQSGTDAILGSAIQWTEDVLIGYQNVSVGVKHISNAGIIMPNMGRNQVLIQYTIPIWY